MASLITTSSGDFADSISTGGKLLGLDVGTRTVGLAICDAGWHFAVARDKGGPARGCFGR